MWLYLGLVLSLLHVVIFGACFEFATCGCIWGLFCVCYMWLHLGLVLNLLHVVVFDTV